MQGNARIQGLDEAMKAMQAAFPNDYKKQAQLVNSAMGGSARKSILPIAKSMALAGDGSGALSQALNVRAQKKRQRRGKAGGLQIVPVRHDKKAIRLYVSHYYTSNGKNAPLGIVASGIRHGHLVEFGTVKMAARPFLWPAGKAGQTAYIALFAQVLKKRIASAVKREARKAKK